MRAVNRVFAEVEHRSDVISRFVNVADWLTTILSPATFALVLVTELRFRRRFSSVRWWLHYDRVDEDDDGEKTMYVYRLLNLGSESATNFVLEATPGVQTSGPGMGLVKSGETYEMTIRSFNFDQDWMLISWINTDDTRYVRYQWFPLNLAGSLEDARLKQWNTARRLRWWSKPKAVGPGAGALGTRVRALKGDKTAKGMDKARSLLVATRSIRSQNP